jgi:hypothetical protein
MKKKKVITPKSAVRELAALYRKNGYVRRRNPVRHADEDCMTYKKGEELRLTADSVAERAHVLRLLRIAGFKPGRPYVKYKPRGRYRVPVYGREQVALFLSTIESLPTEKLPGASKKIVGKKSVSKAASKKIVGKKSVSKAVSKKIVGKKSVSKAVSKKIVGKKSVSKAASKKSVDKKSVSKAVSKKIVGKAAIRTDSRPPKTYKVKAAVK